MAQTWRGLGVIVAWTSCFPDSLPASQNELDSVHEPGHPRSGASHQRIQPQLSARRSMRSLMASRTPSWHPQQLRRAGERGLGQTPDAGQLMCTVRRARGPKSHGPSPAPKWLRVTLLQSPRKGGSTLRPSPGPGSQTFCKKVTFFMSLHI